MVSIKNIDKVITNFIKKVNKIKNLILDIEVVDIKYSYDINKNTLDITILIIDEYEIKEIHSFISDKLEKIIKEYLNNKSEIKIKIKNIQQNTG